MIVSPLPNYLSQRDNVNPHTQNPSPNNQCSVTACTMVINWLGDKFSRHEINQFHLKEDAVYLALENLREQKETIVNGRLIKKDNGLISENVRFFMNTVLAKMDIPLIANMRQVKGYPQLRDTLEKYKQPLFSSTGTALTSAGHFFVVIGYSQGHIIVNDPYGVWERTNSNFDNPSEHYRCGGYTSKYGDGIIYDKSIVDKIYCESVPANIIVFDKLS